MKVAVLSLHSFEHVKGGTELFCEHLKRAFPDLDLITYDDITRSRLPSLQRLNLEEARMGMAVSKRLREMMERKDYDLVICNSTAGWSLPVKRLGMPVINVFHYTMKGLAEGTLRGTSGFLPSRYFLPFFEKAAARGRTVLAVSSKVSRELNALYGVGSQVIENGVDLERFRPFDKMEARERLGIHTDGPLALFVGRADHTKGFDLIQEVARLRPHLRVICVTPNDVRDPRMIVRRDVPNHVLPLCYSAADLLLFPSRYESFGYAPLEAMACGCPIVASRTGILEDMADGRAGEILGRLTAEELARAVDRVLRTDYDPRAVVSERFSLDRFAERYRAAADRVVNRNGERRSKNAHLDTSGS